MTTPLCCTCRPYQCLPSYIDTTLEQAILSGHTECIEKLLPHIEDINRDFFIHQAVRTGNIHVVEQLLEYSGLLFNKESDPVLVNTQDSNGDTPLHIAVRMNFKHLVRLLLENDANPHLKNNQLMSPIDLAPDDSIKNILKNWDTL